MKLYDRDYNILTDTEKEEYAKVLEREKIGGVGKIFVRKNLSREYPKAVRHFNSLFPNNYLDILDLEKKEKLEVKLNEYLIGLDCGILRNERDVTRFIKNENAYYIIGSIFNYYDFGHHAAFIFPEFQLSSNYKVDYLLIGKNSDGFSYIFVELEHPEKDITLASGELGNAFRKGIMQTKDWKKWLYPNFNNFYDTLKKFKKVEKQLPEEFYMLDPTRINFVVVAGRRKNFNETTRRIKREHLEEQKIRLLHYDNLIDNTLTIIERGNY